MFSGRLSLGCLLALVGSSIAATQIPTTTPTTTTPRPCPMPTCLPAPEVCGSDGKTYATECWLNANKCRDPTLTKAHDGACTPTPTPTQSTYPCPMPTCLPGPQVCGNDGKTYSTACWLNANRWCYNQSLTIEYVGACGHPTCGSEAEGVTACPSGLYCQPWNPKQYDCRSIDAKCGKQETGIDFYGDDIKTLQLTLPEQCCDACFNTPDCQAYTFVNYNPDGKAYCYLKRGTGVRQNKTGVVSAKIQRSCTAKEWDSCGNPSTGAQCCPENDYCQPWDVNFFQCVPKPAKCSVLYPQTDFYGDDLAKVLSVGPWECCDRCAATPGCKAYTFVNDNKDVPACYLKSGTGAQKYHATAVSGKLD